MPREELHARVDNDFDYHPPQDTYTVTCHETIRATLKSIAHDLVSMLPECRETSLALTKLEEAMFWANAAIARNHERNQ